MKQPLITSLKEHIKRKTWCISLKATKLRPYRQYFMEITKGTVNDIQVTWKYIQKRILHYFQKYTQIHGYLNPAEVTCVGTSILTKIHQLKIL